MNTPQQPSPDWTGSDVTGPNPTGPDRTGSDVAGPNPTGPDPGFVTLFDDIDDIADIGPTSLKLPPTFCTIYGGDWAVPAVPGVPGMPAVTGVPAVPGGPAAAQRGRAHTIVNFVTSRDGRISYAEPGRVGGAAVAGGSAADLWLMALLRSRADAVLVGDGTARAEPDHLWTPEFLGTADTAAFQSLRAAERRTPVALHVICSLSGEIERSWAAVARDDIPLVIATTTAGASPARERLRGRPHSEVVAFGDDRVDTFALGVWLAAQRGVAVLLCEGGPGLYGSLLADAAVDEEFLTLSPQMVGSEASSGARRPSLVEGIGFAPDASPRSIPLSLRRAGDHLMLRSRIAPG